MSTHGGQQPEITWRIWLLALVPALLWGSSYTVTKALYAEWSPLSVAAGRWVLAALAFAVYLPLSGQGARFVSVLRAEFWRVLPFGAVGISLLYAVQNVGLSYTTAVNASVLGNLIPLFVVLLAVLFLGEPLTRRVGGGVFLGTAGALIFSLEGGAFAVAPEHLLGDGLMLLAALAGGLYVVLGKPLVDRHPPAVVTALAALVGAAFLLPTALLVEGLPPLPGPGALAGLLMLGLGSSVVGNLAWWVVAAQLPANRAALFILLTPLAGALVGVIFLGDPLTGGALVGGGLILVALYLAEMR